MHVISITFELLSLMSIIIFCPLASNLVTVWSSVGILVIPNLSLRKITLFQCQKILNLLPSLIFKFTFTTNDFADFLPQWMFNRYINNF